MKREDEYDYISKMRGYDYCSAEYMSPEDYKKEAGNSDLWVEKMNVCHQLTQLLMSYEDDIKQSYIRSLILRVEQDYQKQKEAFIEEDLASNDRELIYNQAIVDVLKDGLPRNIHALTADVNKQLGTSKTDDELKPSSVKYLCTMLSGHTLVRQVKGCAHSCECNHPSCECTFVITDYDASNPCWKLDWWRDDEAKG